MRFDKENAFDWIDSLIVDVLAITPFLRSVCKCVYAEDTLVKMPQFAVLGCLGMTANGPVVGTPDAETDPIPTLEQLVPPRRVIAMEHREQFNQMVAAERLARPDAPIPSNYALAVFRFAGGTIPIMSYGTRWSLRHLYDGHWGDYNTEHFYGAEQHRINALNNAKHFSQSAGLVAVHPLVNDLWGLHPWIAFTLRARAAVTLGYDPDHVFFDRDHDACGFVS